MAATVDPTGNAGDEQIGLGLDESEELSPQEAVFLQAALRHIALMQEKLAELFGRQASVRPYLTRDVESGTERLGLSISYGMPEPFRWTDELLQRRDEFRAWWARQAPRSIRMEIMLDEHTV